MKLQIEEVKKNPVSKIKMLLKHGISSRLLARRVESWQNVRVSISLKM
jgi:hypothetical protein